MRKLVVVLLLSMMPFAANAEWVGGFGYYNLSIDEAGLDISLGVLAPSIGYRFESDTNLTWMPELRLGFGLGDDTVIGVDVEIDQLIAFSVRGQYDFDNGAYLFFAPSYASVEFGFSAPGASASEDETEFGYGGGVGFNFSDTASGELSFEMFDDADLLGVSVRFGF